MNELLEKGIQRSISRLKGAKYEPKEEIPDIEGTKPHVFATKKLEARRVLKALVKVETSDTISEEQAKKDMEAFAKWSSKYISRTAMLFIPAGCGPKAQQDLPFYDEYYEY